MSQTGNESFANMGKWRRLGRIVYGVIPFVVAGALIIASLHLVLFATEASFINESGADEIYIHSNQTYTYNVTVSFRELPPNLGGSVLNENGSIAIEHGIVHDTITSWTRVWLPISIYLNSNLSDIRVYQTLERPNGIFEQGPSYAPNYGELATSSRTGFNPEMTQGGTERVTIENLGSVDANVSVSWKTYFHFFNRPYFDYGLVALGIGLLFPVAFVINQVVARRGKFQ